MKTNTPVGESDRQIDKSRLWGHFQKRDWGVWEGTLFNVQSWHWHRDVWSNRHGCVYLGQIQCAEHQSMRCWNAGSWWPHIRSEDSYLVVDIGPIGLVWGGDTAAYTTITSSRSTTGSLRVFQLSIGQHSNHTISQTILDFLPAQWMRSVNLQSVARGRRLPPPFHPHPSPQSWLADPGHGLSTRIIDISTIISEIRCLKHVEIWLKLICWNTWLGFMV
jgi:hypothetical protein